MDGVALTGGYGTPGVVRNGDTVRRGYGENAPFVHALLRHLEDVGFDGAPRFLGIDDQGREILSFVEGEVVGELSEPLSEARLFSAGTLIRGFHDASAGSSLAGTAEVVCHGELGPHNTVFVGDEAVALIDWDTAGPGRRVGDLDHAAWFYAELTRRRDSPRAHARRVGALCEGYGWADPSQVINELEARLRRCYASAEAAGREAGERIFGDLVAWMVENGPAIKAEL
jgi:aminoglycoside phosphotransferase